MEEVRSCWQLPSIAHFLDLFRPEFKFPKITYEDLETAFFERTKIEGLSEHGDGDNNDNNSVTDELNGTNPLDHCLLLKIIIRLLKCYFDHHPIDHQNWDRYLYRVIKIQYVDREGNKWPFVKYDFRDPSEIEETKKEKPEKDEQGEEDEDDDAESEDSNSSSQFCHFDDLPVRTKIEIVYKLCEYALCGDASSEAVKDYNGDDLRVEPLGRDNAGNVYWYFYGTRLYRENPKKAEEIKEKLKKREEAFAGLDQRIQKWKEEKAKRDAKEKALAKAAQKAEKKTSQKGTPKTPPPPRPGQRGGLRERKPVVSQPPPPQPSPKKAQPKQPVLKELPKIDVNKELANIEKEHGVSIDEFKEAWRIECQNVEDWRNLVEKFKKSRFQCEKEFYQLLSEKFLPGIEKMFEEQEAERRREERRKLMELIPRKRSSRIETKKIQQEEEERRREEERKLRQEQERQRRIQEAERKRQEKERLKEIEREERARKRLQLIEERAKRAQLEREEDMEEDESNSYSGISERHRDAESSVGNIDTNSCNSRDPTHVSLESNCDSVPSVEEEIEITTCSYDALNDNSGATESDDCSDGTPTFYNRLEKVIAAVLNNIDAWPFKDPVNAQEVPTYYDVIKEPITLTDIQDKVRLRSYPTLDALESDFKKLVNNCEQFNGPLNGFTKMAHAIWRALKRAVKHHLDRTVTDEREIFMYPPRNFNTNLRPAIEARKRKAAKARNSSRKECSGRTSKSRHNENLIHDTSSRSSISSFSEDVRTSSRASYNSYDTQPAPQDPISKPKESSPQPQPSSLQAQPSSAALPQIHGDVVASYVSTAPNQNGTLSFKTITDVAGNIKKSYILPQNAVIIRKPPISSPTVINGPSSVAQNEKPLIAYKIINPQNHIQASNNNNKIDLASLITKTVAPGPNAQPQQLVIKVSKCDGQSLGSWAPSVAGINTATPSSSTATVVNSNSSPFLANQKFNIIRLGTTIPNAPILLQKRTQSPSEAASHPNKIPRTINSLTPQPFS